MMKQSVILTLAFVAFTDAFKQPSSSISPPTPKSSSTALFEYIPTGFTKESWAKFKAEEAKKKAAQKNLGRLGPKGFQSRSFQSFQEALERGEAAHLMPVENAKKRLASGELKMEDIPYMQRGGAWDNSDVKGAKRKNWLASDKAYAGGGYKKSQSVSILGEGAGLDWTGSRDRTGPQAKQIKFDKNYKAPNVKDMKKGTQETPKKKGFFGLF